MPLGRPSGYGPRMSMPRHWDPISEQDFWTAWPMAAEKCELIDGVIVWYGRFSSSDCRAAERALGHH
jgi:hypothetical protein